MNIYVFIFISPKLFKTFIIEGAKTNNLFWLKRLLTKLIYYKIFKFNNNQNNKSQNNL